MTTRSDLGAGARTTRLRDLLAALIGVLALACAPVGQGAALSSPAVPATTTTALPTGAASPVAVAATTSPTPASSPVTLVATPRRPSPSPTANAAGPVVVEMGDHFYSPAQLTVPVGTTVLWRMYGSQTHDVLSLDGKFYSRTMGPGQTFSHTFTEPGTFRYICTPHQGDGMVGEVTVR